jgi:hypothetical protein
LKTSWTKETLERRFWSCATYHSKVSSFMIEVLPLDNLSEFLLTVLL